MRAGLFTICVVIGSLALTANCPAAECPYFPMQDGFWWEFVGDDGDHARAWIDGTQVVQGHVTTVLHWQFRDENQEDLYQYYSADSTGALLFHGFSSQEAGLTVSYDPPFTDLLGSLVLGAEWCTRTQAYGDLEGATPWGDSIDICLRVESVGDLEVPAGHFTAFGIGSFLPRSSAPVPGRDVFGFPKVESLRQPSDWYAEDVGEIAFNIYQDFVLTMWEGVPTPVVTGTWGSLKSRFVPNNGLQRAGALPPR